MIKCKFVIYYIILKGERLLGYNYIRNSIYIGLVYKLLFLEVWRRIKVFKGFIMILFLIVFFDKLNKLLYVLDFWGLG